MNSQQLSTESNNSNSKRVVYRSVTNEALGIVDGEDDNLMGSPALAKGSSHSQGYSATSLVEALPLLQEYQRLIVLNTAAASSDLASKKVWRKPLDKPKRPLSAYNLFFQLERERLVEEGLPETGDDTLDSPSFKIPYTAEDVQRVVELSLRKSQQQVVREGDDSNGEGAIIAVLPPAKRKHRKTHGKIGFADLARTIAGRWKKLSEADKQIFEKFAVTEKQRYKTEIVAWTKKQKKLQQEEDRANRNIVLSSTSEYAKHVPLPATALAALAGASITPDHPPTRRVSMSGNSGRPYPKEIVTRTGSPVVNQVEEDDMEDEINEQLGFGDRQDEERSSEDYTMPIIPFNVPNTLGMSNMLNMSHIPNMPNMPNIPNISNMGLGNNNMLADINNPMYYNTTSPSNVAHGTPAMFSENPNRTMMMMMNRRNVMTNNTTNQNMMRMMMNNNAENHAFTLDSDEYYDDDEDEESDQMLSNTSHQSMLQSSSRCAPGAPKKQQFSNTPNYVSDVTNVADQNFLGRNDNELDDEVDQLTGSALSMADQAFQRAQSSLPNFTNFGNQDWTNGNPSWNLMEIGGIGDNTWNSNMMMGNGFEMDYGNCNNIDNDMMMMMMMQEQQQQQQLHMMKMTGKINANVHTNSNVSGNASARGILTPMQAQQRLMRKRMLLFMQQQQQQQRMQRQLMLRKLQQQSQQQQIDQSTCASEDFSVSESSPMPASFIGNGLTKNSSTSNKSNNNNNSASNDSTSRKFIHSSEYTKMNNTNIKMPDSNAYRFQNRKTNGRISPSSPFVTSHFNDSNNGMFNNNNSSPSMLQQQQLSTPSHFNQGKKISEMRMFMEQQSHHISNSQSRLHQFESCGNFMSPIMNNNECTLNDINSTIEDSNCVNNYFGHSEGHML